MAYPQTLNDFSRGRRAAVIAILGRGRDTSCELVPGTCADMTVC